MSRKKAEKSNIPQIGIFTDKSTTYNLAILETLHKLGGATAWQIAKKIAEKQKPVVNKDMETKSRRIYSVIQRKDGRLNDLANKGYIGENEGLWQLTFKGNFALAIKKPEITNSISDDDRNQAIEQFRQVINTMPDEIVKAPLGITINRSETKQDISKLLDQIKKNPALHKLIIEELTSLLSESGINLDRVDEYTLVSLLMNRQRVKDQLKQLYKQTWKVN